MASVLQSDYTALLGEIKQRIRSAQYAALKAVNKELIALYWDIGRMIVERQAGKSWGRAVIAQLAADLQTEFPGVSGYSSRNLWYTRSFYLCYGSNEKLQLLVAEIGWTHNLIIMEKCKDDLGKGGTAPDYFLPPHFSLIPVQWTQTYSLTKYSL